MKHTAFHEDAAGEVIDATAYYEEITPGLGFSFLDDVEESIHQIQVNPKAYILISREVRRKLLRRFPYSILYVVERDVIRILAVAHQKRRPGYWRYRHPTHFRLDR